MNKIQSITYMKDSKSNEMVIMIHRTSKKFPIRRKYVRLKGCLDIMRIGRAVSSLLSSDTISAAMDGDVLSGNFSVYISYL